jgi:DNA-binding NtrC family response regulator
MTKKILFVDDEPNILSGLKRLFHGKFECETANSGAEALAKIRSDGPFAVVVADMQMPGMNGVDLLTAIHSEAPRTVRMMLTGYADRPTAIEAVNKGHVFNFLSKPCSESQMKAALEAGIELYRMNMKIEEIQGTLRSFE